MIGQMANSTALRGFSDLGRTVAPVFLLMDHFLEGCPIHPHCNDPFKAYSVRSIRTDG